MNNIFKKKVFSTTLHPLPQLLEVTLSESEPTCYTQVAKHLHWKEAMTKEFNTLLHSNTWTLVPRTYAMNVIGNKWVFKIKRKADGSIDRYKAKLVAKGFH